MPQRRTSRRTHSSRSRMLELRVSSPRIFWFNCLRTAGGLMKLSVVLLAVIALGWGCLYGYRKLLVDNQEFALQEVPLLQWESEDEPQFMTHRRVVEATGLDLEASIFALDLDHIEKTLQDLPETSRARVTRRLPGTLKIEIEERVPVAWIECPGLGIQGRDMRRGLLVAEDGMIFPCASIALWEYAQSLPILFMNAAIEGSIVSGQHLEGEGMTAALELLSGAVQRLQGEDIPQWVAIRDEICLELMTNGGTLATFSYYEQTRQLENFVKLSRFAREQGRAIKTINLIPHRLIPVTYAETS